MKLSQFTTELLLENGISHPKDIAALAEGWIASKAYTAVSKEPDNDPNWWSYEVCLELCQHQPMLALEFVQAVLDRKPDGTILAVLAAGPLERLLASQGSTVIDEVERLALREPDFRYLLGGVWKNEMADDIWRRMQVARGGIVW